MPFSSTASLTSTDMNNTLRGLYRDNADHAVTGTVAETDMASTSITANTIGATGMLLVMASGTITGAAGSKQIRLYFGGTLIVDSASIAGTAAWQIWLLLINTATNAQRAHYLIGQLSGATAMAHSYITAAVDTTANQTLKVTGTLTNTGDTITQKTFNVHVVQIT